MSWWKYTGRCSGRIFHFLYYYCGFDIAETAKLGSMLPSKATPISYLGKQIATFVWSNKPYEWDVPIFTFIGEDEQVQQWNCNQLLKCEEAILSAVPEIPEGQENVPNNIMRVLQPALYQQARLTAEIHNQPLRFFIAGGKVYFQAGEFFAICDLNRSKYDGVTDWLRLTKY